MAGALDALRIGSVLTDLEGRILACCGRFAAFVDRPEAEIIGHRGREFMRPEDVPAALKFLEVLWATGASFTLTARMVRPDGRSRLYESHVSRLTGLNGPFALSVVRPFNCTIQAVEPDAEMAASKAGYVVDMSGQLADFAADAFMPITCDLLRVAADAAANEGGEGLRAPAI